jgi:hypothetical protein
MSSYHPPPTIPPHTEKNSDKEYSRILGIYIFMLVDNIMLLEKTGETTFDLMSKTKFAFAGI